VRRRRQQLGLRLIDMSRAMGYRSANAVSNVESGIEGVPAKRAYAWADLLELPRDAFFQFVTGQIQHLDVASVSAAPDEVGVLTAEERALLASYRRLTPAMKARLREHAETLEAVAAAPQRRR
jgi:transcriptional regulator with XRE-family HTH domain